MIQIFGKKNCNESKKAERFLKERGIKYQFINLAEKGISKGELKAVLEKYTLEELFDTEGKEYKKRNLQYMYFDLVELLEESPILYKSPIIRDKNMVNLGFDKNFLEELVKKNK